MIRDNVNVPVEKMNLSFAGCGFLGIYHVGVASCFREYLPEIVHNKFSGASVGALVATAMALDCSLAESTSDLLKVAIKARSRALGPFHPNFDVTKILYDALVKALPDDAHKRVSGRLFISVTRVSDGKNKIISHFDSKDDLIQAIQCSCFIPCWSGVLPPKYHGVAYMDGGFSDNLPILNDFTITVAPFAGESDICPQENTFNYMQIQLSNTSFSISPGNLYRITRILFPPHPEEMSKMCLQGFNDALKFLQRANKISCLRCVAIQSSFLLSETDPEEEIIMGEEEVNMAEEAEDDVEEEVETEEEFEPMEVVDESMDLETKYSNQNNKSRESVLNGSRCESTHTSLHFDDASECKSCREMIDLHSLPDPVAKAIQEAIDSVNKGLINWIYKHRPVRVLSLLTIPFTLPFDLALIFAIKSLRMVPVITNELKRSLVNVIAFILKEDKYARKKATTRFSCQLAITEFGANKTLLPTESASPSPIKITKPSCMKRKESVFNLESPFNRRKLSTHVNPRLSSSTTSRLEKSETLPPMHLSSASDLRSRLREESKVKRNSYAGKEFSYSSSNLSRSASCQRERRKTVAGLSHNTVDCSASTDRITQRMNFGFTVDLPVDRLAEVSRKNSTRWAGRPVGISGGCEETRGETSSTNSSAHNLNSSNDVLLTVLQSLGENVDPSEIDLDAKEVTNQALSIEKEYFERFAKSEMGGVDKKTEALDKILDVASNRHALMAFYYLDEKKRVKVTEIFSMPPEADSEDTIDGPQKSSPADQDEEDDGIEIIDDEPGQRSHSLCRKQQRSTRGSNVNNPFNPRDDLLPSSTKSRQWINEADNSSVSDDFVPGWVRYHGSEDKNGEGISPRQNMCTLNQPGISYSTDNISTAATTTTSNNNNNPSDRLN